MMLNLKIEVLKIFSLELNFSSEKKKEDKIAKDDTTSKPTTSK
jgi:hypothetical protein